MSRLLAIELAFQEQEQEEETLSRRHRRDAALLLPLPGDGRLKKLYRLNSVLLEQLIEELGPLLSPPKSSKAIDPVTKILTALVFYARGSYQEDVAKDAPMAQQTVSRCLREVTEALNHPNILRKFMPFPQTRVQRAVIKRGFYDKYRIPGVCGCIDCTHILIIRPADFEERYANRKKKHSLNVQMICDHKCRILNVDARYGGASHDAFIWQNSQIMHHFEHLASTGEAAILLGDSGYPLREFMMIPVIGAAENSPEDRYNRIQKTARSIIERTFGLLKARWRCLLSARELHYKPDVAGKITIACAILHNMCINGGMEPIELTAEEAELERQNLPEHINYTSSALSTGLEHGRIVRARIIAQLTR